jgi:hypothetical protein
MEDGPIPNEKKADETGEKQENVVASTRLTESTASGSKEPNNSGYTSVAWNHLKTTAKVIGLWIKRDSAYWTAAATIAMAITTAIYTYYARRQWQEMKGSGEQTDRLIGLYRQQVAQLTKQAGDTHELAMQAKNQADQTKTIADQAIVQANTNKQLAQNAVDSLANSKQSFRAEQRAWVGVQGTSDSKGFTEKDVWQITVVFFNSGRTPARNVQTSGMYTTSPIPLSGPSPQQVAQLTFRPAQSIAPQGFYRESIGNVIGAEGLV